MPFILQNKIFYQKMLKSIELQLRNIDISENELIDEIKRVSKKIKNKQMTRAVFDLHAKYGSHLIIRKIGWNKAKELAGLTVNKEMNISEQKLMDNLFNVWKQIGRQPRRDEMLPPISVYSISPYREKYGSWTKALLAFKQIAEKGYSKYGKLKSLPTKKPFEHKTKRTISKQLALQVFKRDGWKCKLCSRTNITHPKLEFEIDHIKPYSQNGETVLKNLQVLCKDHNRTKGKMKL